MRMRRGLQTHGLCVLFLEEQIHLPRQSQKILEFSMRVTFVSPTCGHPRGSRQKLLSRCDVLLSA